MIKRKIQKSIMKENQEDLVIFKKITLIRDHRKTFMMKKMRN
jgi:hypothetical protein